MESQASLGSTFYVYLPVCESDISGRTMGESELLHGNEHLLLIDDEPELVRVGTVMITYLGYQVTSLDGSGKALERFRKTP